MIRYTYYKSTIGMTNKQNMKFARRDKLGLNQILFQLFCIKSINYIVLMIFL